MPPSTSPSPRRPFVPVPPLRSALARAAACAVALLACLTAGAAGLGNYASHTAAPDGSSLTITDASGARLQLRPYGTHMVRVRAARPGAAFLDDTRYLMVERHDHGGSLAVDQVTATHLRVTSGAVRIMIARNPLRLQFSEAATGRVLLTDTVGIDLDPQVIRYVFAADAAEQFIGYGQKRLSLQDSLFLAGRTERRNHAEEGYPGRGAQGVLTTPFYISSRGYGIFAHTTYPTEGRFGTGGGDHEFRVEAGGYTSEGDYFLILGPQPAAILDRYTQLTGRPRLPPLSTFGLQLSDNDPGVPGIPAVNEQWWRTMVTNHFAAGFPLDVMIFDNDWRAAAPVNGKIGQWAGSQFAWEPTRYPDPASFARWYRGLDLALSLDLNLNNSNDSAGWLPEYNILPGATTDHNNSLPDYSNPATRAWLWDLFWSKSFNPALNFPGEVIWLDETDAVYVADNTLLANGRTWRENKNYYYFLHAYAAVAEGWDNVEGGATPGIGEARRPHVWIRGGTAGMQRYASHWTGDIDFTNAFYRGHIVGLQASGLAAFPYFNHDAGGFGANKADPTSEGNLEGPDDNFYIQWGMALGSFTPLWRPHGYGFPRWPLNRSLASQESFRRYATLRYEMMPYIYSLAHEAQRTGLPMARPMAVAFPDHDEAWSASQQYQYMWGDSLLVVPALSITGSDERRTAWFPPAAEWYDLWTDVPLTLGRDGGHHTFTARFGDLPVFVRAGAIVPRRTFALTTAALSDRHLVLDVYTGDDGATVLREDDGVTERFRTRGELRSTPITYTHATGLLAIAPASGTYQGASASRSYLARFRGLAGMPAAVLVDGASVAVGTGPLADGTTTAASWDAPRRLLEVRVAERSVGAATAITVTPGTGIDPAPVVSRPVRGIRWERWNQPASPELRTRWNAATDKTAFLRGIMAATPDASGDGSGGAAVPSAQTTGDNFVVRLSGWFIPPESGAYQFWGYGDDRFELHVQADPDAPALTRVAYNTQSQTVNQWDEEAVQYTNSVVLEAGRPHAFEFLLAEFTGNAHGGFGWTRPGGTRERPIPDEHLVLATGQYVAAWLVRQGIAGTDLLGDSDGDRFPNLLEAGFGTFANVRDVEMPELAIMADGRRIIRLPAPAADDIIVELQEAPELGAPWTTLARWTAQTNWRLADPAPAGVTLDAFARRCVDERPGLRRFFRILVTLP